MFDEPDEAVVKPKKVASIFDDDEDEEDEKPAAKPGMQLTFPIV